MAALRAAVVARRLRWLYAVLAAVSVGIAVFAGLHGKYGSAALNAVIAAIWVALLLRLRGR
jgi:hypothetical protein